MVEPVKNTYATSLVVDGCGILVMGLSGSGKTSLALTLIERARWSGRAALLISDDQTFLQEREGRLIACAPPTIAGAVEIRGAGIFHVPYQPEAKVDLCIELVAPEEALRYPSDDPKSQSRSFLGVRVPLLSLAELRDGRESMNSARAVEATLFMKRWSE